MLCAKWCNLRQLLRQMWVVERLRRRYEDEDELARAFGEDQYVKFPGR